MLVDATGGEGADRLEDVLNGDHSAAMAAWLDAAAIEHQPRQVEAGKRHGRRRNGLVAADDAQGGIEPMPDDGELDRVGDEFARDQRGAHPGGAHRDAIGHRDSRELEGGAAGGLDAAAGGGGELAVVEVAGGDVAEGVEDADEGPSEGLIVAPGGAQHGAGGSSLGAFFDRVASHPRGFRSANEKPRVGVRRGVLRCLVLDSSGTRSPSRAVRGE